MVPALGLVFRNGEYAVDKSKLQFSILGQDAKLLANPKARDVLHQVKSAGQPVPDDQAAQIKQEAGEDVWKSMKNGAAVACGSVVWTL